MKKTIFKTGLFLVVALFAMSCSKDGEVGPAGPAGANGINGTNGTNGNANVNGTTDFTILPTDWLSSGNLKYVTITNNGVTQNIVNTGMVMVYQKVNNSYIALPFSNSGIDRGFSFGLNYIQISLSAYNNTAFTISTNFTIRAVIVSSTNKMANPNINWKNYEEVKRALNLAD